MSARTIRRVTLVVCWLMIGTAVAGILDLAFGLGFWGRLPVLVALNLLVNPLVVGLWRRA